MGLTREQMIKLELDSASMGTANHGRYLSDAMLALRDPAFSADPEADEIEAPLRALRLLTALWGKGHAMRPDQKMALNDIGQWLEKRLTSAPALPTAALLLDLGWLKRLAQPQEAARRGQERGPRSHSVVNARAPSFGARILDLERRRRATFAARTAASVEAARPERANLPSAPVQPVALPEVLSVEIADFVKAREARVNAAKRAEKKKEPRDALLDLRAGGAWVGLKLVCSTVRTSGMAEVFERIRTTSGAPEWRLQAAGLVRDADGVVFVARLSMEAPAGR